MTQQHNTPTLKNSEVETLARGAFIANGGAVTTPVRYAVVRLAPPVRRESRVAGRVLVSPLCRPTLVVGGHADIEDAARQLQRLYDSLYAHGVCPLHPLDPKLGARAEGIHRRVLGVWDLCVGGLSMTTLKWPWGETGQTRRDERGRLFDDRMFLDFGLAIRRYGNDRLEEVRNAIGHAHRRHKADAEAIAICA